MGTSVQMSSLSNASDALYREWVGAIIDSLVEAGAVQTADTGQFDPLTSTAPSSSNTWASYAVFYLNDSLHSTHPIYLRLDFGSGDASSTLPAARLTVGKGSDGAGNISTVLFQAVLGRTTGHVADTAQRTHYAVSGEGYVGFTGFVDQMASSISAAMIFFVIERSRNADGTVNGDAVSIMNITISATAGVGETTSLSGWSPRVRCVNYSSGNFYEMSVPVSGLTSINGVSPGPTTAIAAGGIGPVFPWVLMAPGVAPWQACATLSVPYGDHPSGDFETVLCGSPATFRPLPIPSTGPSSTGWNRRFGMAMSMASSPANNGWFGLCIRWED